MAHLPPRIDSYSERLADHMSYMALTSSWVCPIEKSMNQRLTGKIESSSSCTGEKSMCCTCRRDRNEEIGKFFISNTLKKRVAQGEQVCVCTKESRWT
jgi:hypothetical protein